MSPNLPCNHSVLQILGQNQGFQGVMEMVMALAKGKHWKSEQLVKAIVAAVGQCGA